jgi:hypothetical protein
MAKINDKDVNKISVPVTANIEGTFASPKVSTDLSSSVSNLTKQLVDIEKQKLLNQGKGKIKSLLGGLTGIKGSTATDSTNSQTNLAKTDTTTTKTKSAVEEGVKNILGGLLKKRKKKDSIN